MCVWHCSQHFTYHHSALYLMFMLPPPGSTPWLPPCLPLPSPPLLHKRLSCPYLGLCSLPQNMCCPLPPIRPGWACLSLPFHFTAGEWSHHIPFLLLGHPHIHLACPCVSFWSLLKMSPPRRSLPGLSLALTLPYFAPHHSYYIWICLAVYCLPPLGERSSMAAGTCLRLSSTFEAPLHTSKN